MTDKQFSVQDLKSFLLATSDVRTELAERLVYFFHSYKDGLLRPDRYNRWEPIRYVYEESKIPEYVRALSYPGGSYFAKKMKGLVYSAMVENEQYNPTWSEEKKGVMVRVLPNKSFIPKYLILK